MEKLISFILILLCFQSCIHRNQREGFIEFKSEVKADTIKSISINRGILTLNKEYYIHGNSILVFKDNFPKWIEDHGKPDYSFDEYVFKPFITDIDAPYVLYKFKNEKYFYIIKNNDTLKFELGEF